MKMENYLKKDNQLRYQKFLISLKMYNYFGILCQEFRFKIVDETRNYFLEELKQNN